MGVVECLSDWAPPQWFVDQYPEHFSSRGVIYQHWHWHKEELKAMNAIRKLPHSGKLVCHKDRFPAWYLGTSAKAG